MKVSSQSKKGEKKTRTKPGTQLHAGVLRVLCLCAALMCISPRMIAQEQLSLQRCLEYTMENNRNLKKSRYDQEKAAYARKEVLGALLPQINGSANLNDNLKKAKFIMPNFVNNMLPPNAQDKDAPKYMTVEMGTTYSANVGLSLNQQLVNFPLFNALKITQAAERMAALGTESNEEDLIAQVANLYYAVQSTEHAVQSMRKSVELVEKMLEMMEVNYANGLVKKVDVDRLKVNLVNLTTQISGITNAAEVQKNLLKLQMGFDVNDSISIEPFDRDAFEDKVGSTRMHQFAVSDQTAYRLLLEKKEMARLQKKSAKYEYLPTLSLMFNLQYNGVSDQFFRGETNYWYPTSMVGISLRVPIFSGFSRRSKVRQSDIELMKAGEDIATLEQSLKMAHRNAQMKLDDAQRTLLLQKDNQKLAEDVFGIAENNFVFGISSMSDVLNASQSLVQAQMSYANALYEYMKAYIELKKSSGNIRDLMTDK